MNSYRIEITKYDTSRPFTVICNEQVLGPVKGRYTTKAQAQARVRSLLSKEG